LAVPSQACTLLDATPVRHLDWHTAKVTPAFKDAEKKVKAKPGTPSSLWMAMGMVEMDQKVLECFSS
jgi:hypothetical protein